MGDYALCKFANPMGDLTFCICNAICTDIFLAEIINPKDCKKCPFFETKNNLYFFVKKC